MWMLHENMRIFRKQLQLTQQDVARMLNVDRSTYTSYETKRIPSLDILIKLSRLYCVSLDELVGINYDLSLKATVREDQSPIFGNDELDIFDKYLYPSERNLLFSIRLLTKDQIKEVTDLIEKYADENSVPKFDK